MTDYDTMTDEELSAAVAVRVMGWRRHAMGGWIDAGTVDDDVTYFSAPNYAVSWADAGRVLEKMRADGWEIVLNFGGMSKDPERQCFATFMRESDDGGPWHDHQGIGESLPHAICIAALRAVEARA